MKKTKKVALLSMCVCLCLLLSFVESRIPPLTAIPGVKLGLANIAVVFALYKLGSKEAVIVSVVRVFLAALLFGSAVSFLYSLAGGVLSLAVMLALKRFTPFGETGVSVCGALSHNIGQICVACVLLSTGAIAYYLPFLMLSGTVSGVLIGIVSAIMIKRIQIR